MRRISITLLLVGAFACSKPVSFQGQSTLSIVGDPPVVSQPVVEPPRVEVRDNKIEIREKIQFEYDKAVILPVSFDLMNEIVAVITKNPHIKKIRIEGHASSEGDAGHNQRLSEARAKAVRAYLVQKGIAVPLIAQGFGISKPIGDNTTETGREQNRRVEFAIVEQDVTMKRVEIDKQGNEKVLEEKTEKIQAGDASRAAK